MDRDTVFTMEDMIKAGPDLPRSELYRRFDGVEDFDDMLPYPTFPTVIKNDEEMSEPAVEK